MKKKEEEEEERKGRSPEPGKNWKEDVNGPERVGRTHNKFRYFITEILKLFLHRIPFTLIHKISI